MKPLNLFAALLGTLLLSTGAGAQTIKDVFANEETPLFYYGIDFTKFRLIDDATANAEDIVDRQFDGINDLIVNEPKKYDLAGAFRRSTINHDLSYVSKKNEKADVNALKSTTTDDFARLTEKDIEATVKGMTTGNQKGVGLLFVAEAASKSKKAMAVWVTFFDIKTKKVLHTERIEGKLSMAFPFRNQMGTAIKSVIDQVDKKKYKEWKAKYAG